MGMGRGDLRPHLGEGLFVLTAPDLAEPVVPMRRLRPEPFGERRHVRVRRTVPIGGVPPRLGDREVRVHPRRHGDVCALRRLRVLGAERSTPFGPALPRLGNERAGDERDDKARVVGAVTVLDHLRNERH